MTASPETAAVPRPGLQRRFWLPLTVLALLAGFLIVNFTWELSGALGRTGQVVFTLVAVLLATGVIGVWFIGSRQFHGRVKLLVGAAVIMLGLGAVSTIRDVEFTGDNIPIPRFRWEPTLQQRLAPFAPANATAAEKSDESFFNFFGADRDGNVPGPVLATDWTANSPREIWRRPVGGGYSAFVVGAGLAVTLEQRDGEEELVAYNADTGSEVWKIGHPTRFSEALGGDGPRATPTIDGTQVFALGASGHLFAVDLASGREQWNRDVLKDSDVKNIPWGMSGSPLVVGSLVVVNPGGPKQSALVAYDRATGARRFGGGDHVAGYSSPMQVTLGEQPQWLLLDAEGVSGYSVDDARELWHFPWTVQEGISVAQPVALPCDRVFISAGYGKGGVLLSISKEEGRWTAKPIWENTNMKCKFTSPVAHDGFLYGLDDGVLACIDIGQGERRWKRGRYGHGQLLRRGDVLLIMAENGDLVLASASPDGPNELARLPALPGGKTWNAPAVTANRAYLRNHLEAVCYELPLTER